MKKTNPFECMECGFQSPKYYGKCPQCNEWNSLVEAADPEDGESGTEQGAGDPVWLDEIDNSQVKRLPTGMPEFDRVLGGGIVPRSIILIGGEPGTGKSTLLLQISGILSGMDKKVLYFSGEESASQIKLRSDRVGLVSNRIQILTMTTFEELKGAVAANKPDFLVIDSIQTISSSKTKGISGSTSALKWITSQIIELAKKEGITVFIIGHITKDGQLAGPKTLEHMVDAVLYFQGEAQTDIRVLRAEKNRFGSLDEVGIFNMGVKGLVSVVNPAAVLLQPRKGGESGVAVFPARQGMRSILIEIQALVSESPFAGNPRRISIGFDSYRLSMLISIIEKKMKLPFYKSDVFLNVTSGIQIRDTAADLAICHALISSYKNWVLPQRAIILGEVGLTGEIRPVNFLENRIKEAERQGFEHFIVPGSQADLKTESSFQMTGVETIFDFYRLIDSSRRNG